jgi:tetratricopeptide (TPR) repeat protein
MGRSMRRFLTVILATVCGPHGLPAQRLIVKTSIAELEAAAHRDSLDPAAHYNLALGYWSKQQWDRVEVELHAALSIDTRFAPGYLALAFLPQADGKAWREEVLVLPGGRQLVRYIAVDTVVQQFERLYRRAFLIDPLVDIRIVVATEWRGGTIGRLDRALYAYDDGKWDEAFRRFGDMLADSADYRGEKSRLYEEIIWYHALAGARLGRYEPAIRDLSDLIDRSQRREASDTISRWPLRTNEYRYTLAFLKQRASDPQGALQMYREALASDLGLYMAHVHMAEIYEAAGMWVDAVAARRGAVAANPDDPSLLLDLGKTLANAGHWTEAEGSLQEAADANPRDVRVYFYLGAVEQQLGKAESARAAFSRFISLAPTRYGPQVTNAKQRIAGLQ